MGFEGACRDSCELFVPSGARLLLWVRVMVCCLCLLVFLLPLVCPVGAGAATALIFGGIALGPALPPGPCFSRSGVRTGYGGGLYQFSARMLPIARGQLGCFRSHRCRDRVEHQGIVCVFLADVFTEFTRSVTTDYTIDVKGSL